MACELFCENCINQRKVAAMEYRSMYSADKRPIPGTQPKPLTMACVMIVLLLGVACGTTSAAPSATTPISMWIDNALACGPCLPELCSPLPTGGCPHGEIRDACGCCNICDVRNATDEGMVVVQNADADNACAAVRCSRQQQCFVNIQGLPMCRCPSPYMCRRQPRREVCGRDGHTYQSRCYVQIAECTTHKKIRVAHRGACYTDSVKKQNRPSAASSLQGVQTVAPRPEGRRRKSDREDTETGPRNRKENGRKEGDRGDNERRDGKRKNKKRQRRKNRKQSNKDRERTRPKRRFPHSRQH